MEKDRGTWKTYPIGSRGVAVHSLRGKIIGIFIAVWWVVMMATLVNRYVIQGIQRENAPPLDTAVLAESWKDTEEWMQLQWNGVPLGVMRTTARRVDLTPVVTSESDPDISTQGDPVTRYHIAIQIGMRMGPLSGGMWTSALLDDRLMLDQFQVRVNLGGIPGDGSASELRIDGVSRRDRLWLRMERGDALQYKTVKLVRPSALSESLRPLFGRTDLKVGDRYTLPVFDPVWNLEGGTMTVSVAARESIAVGGRTVETLRVETQTGGGVKTTTWVDEKGTVWRRQMPPLDMSAIDFETAVERFPWMRDVPPPPQLRPETLRGENRGGPLRSSGLIGLLQNSLSPPETSPDRRD